MKTLEWDDSYEHTYRLRGYTGIVLYSYDIAYYQGSPNAPYFAFICHLRGTGKWFENKAEAEAYLDKAIEQAHAEGRKIWEI